MIFVRLFIDKIPDTWSNQDVWTLAAIETLVEAFLLSILGYFVGMWIGI